MGRYSRRNSRWPAYVPVAKRQANATKHATKMRKAGQILSPILIEGRAIATTFWGKAWCKHLETYSDAESRLPRGCTYVRNGSVINLDINEGLVNATVVGSSIYTITVSIDPIEDAQWSALIARCSGSIGTLIELLQGKFSTHVMDIMSDPDTGLFPDVEDIELHCTCYDYAVMCKHVAAVLYGIGHRLDDQPELLFKLRRVNHLELLASATASSLGRETSENDTINDSDLSALFGIDIDATPTIASIKRPRRQKSAETSDK